jgi:hypothetical protein
VWLELKDYNCIALFLVLRKTYQHCLSGINFSLIHDRWHPGIKFLDTGALDLVSYFTGCIEKGLTTANFCQ